MHRKDFRIELGLNRKAAHLSRTNPNMRLFPLQNALIDVTDEDEPLPAWYTRLETGDALSFRLVDITHLARSEPPEPAPNLVKLTFRDPDRGRPADPFEEDVRSWRISHTCELRPSPVFSRERSPDLPTWNVEWRGDDGWKSGRLTLARPSRRKYRGFEMAVAVDIRRDGWVDQYVFDPEMIVSEHDN
jgi:hypothetical protein